MEDFARPLLELTKPVVGTLGVAASPTAGQGVALDSTGNLPTAVLRRIPSYEFGRTSFTSQVSVTATTEATANTVVTAPAITFNGSTVVRVEFQCAYLQAPNSLNVAIILVLYDGASSLGLLASGAGVAQQQAPGSAAHILTPSAGTHTYSIRAFVGSGTGFVTAGVGGSGAYQPGYIRITRV